MHVHGRWRLFPFEALLEHLPEQGRFLDLGCGNGLWTFVMANFRPNAEVVGIDADPRKIAVARQVAENSEIDNVRFYIGDAGDFSDSGYSLICAVDVFYLLKPGLQREIIKKASDRLEPGGKFILKTMGKQPGWKFALNVFEETLAVRVFRFTQGGRFHFRDAPGWRALFMEFGFTVVRYPLDRGYPHPHLLLVARKP